MSGTATKMTSAFFTASAVVRTSKPCFLAPRNRFAAGIEADDDLDAALLEIKGVGVALGTEADNGHGFAFEYVQSQRLCRNRFLRA